MDLEKLKIENLSIAKSKGYGIEEADISVPEKIALIHSEISEAYEGYLAGNFLNRHGFNEELADVFLRSLHLAGIWRLDLSSISTSPAATGFTTEQSLLQLHKIISECYEAYRHKQLINAYSKLEEALSAILTLAISTRVDLEQEALKKMELNKQRIWDKKSLNEGT